MANCPHSDEADRSPGRYRKLGEKRAENTVSLYYRYGGHSVVAEYVKDSCRFRINAAVLAEPPWSFPDLLMKEAIDLDEIDYEHATESLAQEFGLYFDPAEYRGLGVPGPFLDLTVDPAAGILVRDVDGQVAETILEPAAPGQPA